MKMKTLSKKRLSSSRPISSKDWNHSGINKVIIEQHDGFATVFKPASGEQHYDSLKVELRRERRYYVREALAYDLDKLLGLGIVPVTTVGKSKRKIGSRQLWMNGMSDWGRRRSDYLGCEREMDKIVVFDYISGNLDRHSGNLLYDKEEKKIWAIDHGMCFPSKMDKWKPMFIEWQDVKKVREGDDTPILDYVRNLPENVKENMRRISRRRFMVRFKKYRMEKEGMLCWVRLKSMLRQKDEK
jgi:hypothetical protein